MKAAALALLCIGLACTATRADQPATPMCEPWEQEYPGEAATGDKVIALWQFTAGNETLDSSGHGHELHLQGATPVAEGRFGGGLQSFPGWPVEDKPHRVTAKNHPALTPKGAFTLELWLRPGPGLNQEYPAAFLLDKKYVSDTDYQLTLGGPTRSGSRTLRACLGFGDSSETWYSAPVRLEAARWYHVAFTYDGQGTGCFFLDGVPGGEKTVYGRKSLAPGKRALSIADRVGSLYHGFPGVVDQVRISNGVLEFRRARFQRVTDRSVFVRMETPASVRFSVTNLMADPLSKAEVTIALDGWKAQTKKVADLASGAATEIDYPLDTTLRPGTYRASASLRVTKPRAYESRETFPITIVARRPPGQFPVVMWGVYGGVTNELDRLERIGFTHALGLRADYGRIFEQGKPGAAADPEAVAAVRQMLDTALGRGFSIAASLSPGSYLRGKEEFRRVDRKGEPYAREDVCGLFPEAKKFCHDVGASVAQTYGDCPAFQAALVHTEVRGHAAPCFHKHDAEEFRKAAGIDIPPQVTRARGVKYTSLDEFPPDRVIPDDHPIYAYYKWYWKTGDGWNDLNSALCQGLRSGGRSDFWTWHDPAVRVASVYGSGGSVDYLSQWTYSYPDPIRIGLATDELLAMRAPQGAKQQVMKMTQIIWYRSKTAPEPKKGKDAPTYRARWEIDQPDAPFITIAPMHLREAFWTKIARPIRGIMYHGWQSLVPCESTSGYRYTHRQTQHELARLIRQVVRPLGPTLLAVPGVRSDVALLESFASEMLAGRGTYGWNGSWAGDCYHVTQWAHLRPEIVFDETITQKGLEGYRVLFMPDCDVITASMAERILAFQAAGGLIVGDENLAPAIKPDILLPVVKRTGQAREDKAALQAAAAQLRKQLDKRYTRYVDTTNFDVVPYRRAYRQTDYVFLVNDHREYGNYVGQHGLVMENGLPAEAVVTIRRPKGAVYDLLAHRRLKATSQDGSLAVSVQLGPCDGQLLMVTPTPIEAVRLKTPEEVKPGSRATCTIEVVGSDGKPLAAVVPLDVDIRDAEGRSAEFSGAYAAVDGRVEIQLDVAPNDTPGRWYIIARELASGLSATGSLRVTGPQPWPPSRGPLPEGAANAVQPQG